MTLLCTRISPYPFYYLGGPQGENFNVTIISQTHHHSDAREISLLAISKNKRLSRRTNQHASSYVLIRSQHIETSTGRVRSTNNKTRWNASRPNPFHLLRTHTSGRRPGPPAKTGARVRRFRGCNDRVHLSYACSPASLSPLIVQLSVLRPPLSGGIGSRQQKQRLRAPRRRSRPPSRGGCRRSGLCFPYLPLKRMSTGSGVYRYHR